MELCDVGTRVPRERGRAGGGGRGGKVGTSKPLRRRESLKGKIVVG